MIDMDQHAHHPSRLGLKGGLGFPMAGAHLYRRERDVLRPRGLDGKPHWHP